MSTWEERMSANAKARMPSSGPYVDPRWPEITAQDDDGLPWLCTCGEELGPTPDDQYGTTWTCPSDGREYI
jgi:hypothetical protein